MNNTLHIQTVQDYKRGCGWRQKGGLYLVGPQLTNPCGRLPFALHACDTCGFSIKPTRSYAWIQIPQLLNMPSHKVDCTMQEQCPQFCPMSAQRGSEKALLIWIGEEHYKTPREFMREAALQGISRRIATVPQNFEVGKTLVFMAHKKAISIRVENDEGEFDKITHQPGIICVFRPTTIEYVVKDKDSDMKLQSLTEKGVTLVKVERME